MIPETKREDNGQLFLRFSWQSESILGNFGVHFFDSAAPYDQVA